LTFLTLKHQSRKSGAGSDQEAHDAALQQMGYLQHGGVRTLAETLAAMDAQQASRPTNTD